MSSHKKKQKQQSQRIPSYFDGFVSDEVHRRLEHVVAPHVESFNYFLEVGMDDAINAIDPMEMEIPDENLNIRMQYSSIEVGYPTRKDITTDNNTLTPREARESGITYAAKLVCNVEVKLNQWEESESTTINLGELPIMVMSDHCHLRGKSSQELVTLKEEANEVGGYFIMNGIERVIRLLQVPRRNYATAIERSSYKNRGLSYSDKGIAMRCVRPDQSSVTITLHYLNNGGATLKFVLRKQEFLLPVVMIAKALVNMSDKELFDRIVQGDINNTFLTTRLEVLLRDFKNYDLYTKTQCLSYLGSLFRGYLPITDAMSDEDAGLMLIKKYIFIHTENFADKLECLLHMIRKLFAFAEGKCVADNADALMNHELLLPGHLLTMYLKEKLEELLLSIKQNVLRDYRMNKAKCLSEIQNIKYFTKNFDRFGSSMGGKIGTFLSTGNIISSTGLDLMQVSGYTIVAERLNIFRYMSHFQSIHRGQFFTTMKTTAVRKLLPESWGYLCPVHTPDGSPCGLLNHIAKDVVVVSYPTHVRLPPTCDADKTITVPPQWNLALINSKSHMVRLLSALGALPSGIGSGDGQLVLSESYMPILFNGILVGGIKHCDAFELVTKLRYLKARSSDASDEKTRVDPTIEIAYFPHNEMHKLAYPGKYRHVA